MKLTDNGACRLIADKIQQFRHGNRLMVNEDVNVTMTFFRRENPEKQCGKAKNAVFPEEIQRFFDTNEDEDLRTYPGKLDIKIFQRRRIGPRIFPNDVTVPVLFSDTL